MTGPKFAECKVRPRAERLETWLVSPTGGAA